MQFNKRMIYVLVAASSGLLLGASVDQARAQTQCQANELAGLLAPDGAGGDGVGTVAVSGDRAVIGAGGDDLFYADGSVGIGTEDPILRTGDTVVIMSATLPWGMCLSASAESPATGKIYIFGGDRPAGPGSDKVLEYDPATDTLVTKSATLPSGNRGLGCAADPATGKIYCFGGLYVGTELDDILEYDPVADTLVVKSATLPAATGVGCAAGPATGKIYVFGGRDDAIWFDEIREYDPATDTIVTMSATLPSARYGMGCVADPGTGRIYCIGGYSVAGGGTFVDEILEYDPGSDTLVTKFATLPSPKYFSGCAADPTTGKIYSLGGGGGGGELDEIVEYDPATDTCVTRPVTLPSINGGPTASADPATGKIYLFGGNAGGGTYGPRLDTIIEYDPPGPTLLLDIKPGSCPNPFNRDSHGVLPAALLGTPDLHVTMIDVPSVRLARADEVGGMVGPHEGPSGPHSEFEDVATPFEGGWCDCHDLTGDGITDLMVHFKTDDVVDILQLDDLDPGALVELVVSGELNDGTDFFASDCVRLVPPGTAPGLLTVQSSVLGAWVDVDPLDQTLDGGGFADFARTFPLTTVVTLTAEEWAQGRPLRGWQIGGLLHHMGETSVEFAIDQDMTVRAVYGPTPSGGTKPPPTGESTPQATQGQSAEGSTIDRR